MSNIVGNAAIQKIYFHGIMANHAMYMNLAQPGFFDEKLIGYAFKTVKDFYTKYHQLPSLEQTIEITKLEDPDGITVDQLRTLWDINIKEYDKDWLKETLECFIEYKSLYANLAKTVMYVKSTPVSPQNIKEISSKVKSMMSQEGISYDTDDGLNFSNAEDHLQIDKLLNSTGYSFLDLAGGNEKKTFKVFVGPPKSGKSIWLNNMACNSVREGRNTAVVTLELLDKKYMKRLGSNLLRIPINDYDKYAKDARNMKKRIDDLAFANMTGKLPGHMQVKEFPTSSATVFDVENYLLRMQDKLKLEFEDVYLDYINIMNNWRNPNTENTYMKIKQLAEDIRAMMQRNNWAGYSATQSKASYFDKNDMDLNAASESSGLAATVDAMYGIIIDPEMRALNQYKLKILANRDGGYMYCSKMFNIDKRFLLVTEDMSSPIIEAEG